jgi:hypothetical protein
VDALAWCLFLAGVPVLLYEAVDLYPDAARAR